jgi:anti-sigma B factor antagonist
MDGERHEQPLPISLDGHGLGLLRVTADRRPGGVSVRLTGEMDIATAPQLVATMRSLSRLDLQHVWLDLAGLTFIDASGLAALVKARMLVDLRGGRLTLHGVRPLVHRLLAITDLSRVFDLEPSLAAPQDRLTPAG